MHTAIAGPVRTSSFILYNLLRFFCLPFFIFGIIYTQLNAILLCKHFQISYTATHALSIRWLLDYVSFRDDPGSNQLVDTLPMMSKRGLLLVFLADIIWSRLCNSFMFDLGLVNNHYITQRTLAFDDIVSNYEDDVDQIISLGTGFDTRCLNVTSSSATSFFDCDLGPLLELKRQALLEAGIDIKGIHFIPIDLRSDHWIQSLCDQGFSFDKKTLVLIEGLTPYISSNVLVRSFKEWVKQCQAPCLMVTDVYRSSFLNPTHPCSRFLNDILLKLCREPFKFLSKNTLLNRIKEPRNKIKILRKQPLLANTTDIGMIYLYEI